MDPLSIAIGTAATKLIARIWTQNTAFVAIDGDIINFVSHKFGNELDRRAVNRQLSTIADDIADRIAPFLEHEVGGIDQGELSAAVDAANKSINSTNGSSFDILFSFDLDSEKLAGHIKESNSGAARIAGLGDAGTAVYDTLVSECASYITNIAHKLPGFQQAKTGELLQRTSRLGSLANEILDGLPASSVPLEWGRGSEDQRFENKYRQAITDYSEHLQLFGVTSRQARNSYPLSVAYISLAVDEVRPVNDRRIARENLESVHRRGNAKVENSDILRIETLLEDTDNLLVTGGAGSGKTTLVQWIAMASMAAPEKSPITESWQNRVPFIISLRRFVGKELPTPELFVQQVSSNLHGAMPAAWVHRVLASGRSTLLIDGLDEIPVNERAKVKTWLLDLVAVFPGNKVLITSRTTAITAEWDNAAIFRRAELLPMESNDMRSFISHWHSAALAAGGPNKRSVLREAQTSMLALIRERPAIRSLCTSPLLCALICALHLESGASLPNNRMDVYRTALEMLVVKRDNDRMIRPGDSNSIGNEERQTLLRKFALWMHENGATEVAKSDFEQKVGQTLGGLYRIKSDTPTISSFLLERSGVLREPVTGFVDFVHRTFLEYLAAAAIVDDNSVDRLIIMAHDDHWREVIVMAAGHANASQRVKLIEGLLDRGTAEPRNKHRLYLLAVACMETSPELSEDIRFRLDKALQDVLPPTNVTDAIAVSSAGSLAIPGLTAKGTHSARVAAACVRALSLIGGDDALDALATYKTDTRVTVTRELIRAWSAFDTEIYANNVLSECILDKGSLIVTETAQINCIRSLKNARSVYLDIPRQIESIEELIDVPETVFGADISGVQDVYSARELPFDSGLTSLTLRSSRLFSLNGIEKFSRLRYLDLSRNQFLVDFANIKSLGNLDYLNLTGNGADDVGGLNFINAVGNVYMMSAPALVSISAPINAKCLTLGYAPKLEMASGLASSSNLRKLTLHGPIGNGIGLDLPAELTDFYQFSWNSINEITGGDNIENLDFHTNISAKTFDWVVNLVKLKTANMSVHAGRVGGLEFDEAIRRLHSESNVRNLYFRNWGYKKFKFNEVAGWKVRSSGENYAYYQRV